MTLLRRSDDRPRPTPPGAAGAGGHAGPLDRRRRQRRALWLSALVYAVAVAALTVLPGWWMVR